MKKQLKKLFTYNFILTTLIIISILLLSIGYSAFGVELTISGEATVYALPNTVEIIDVTFKNSSNGAYEKYNMSYTDESISFYLYLPYYNSTVTYEITIRNNSEDYIYTIDEIISEIYSDTGIVYEINNSNEVYFDQYTETVVEITFYYSSSVTTSQSLTAQLDFTFTEAQTFDDLVLLNNGGTEYIEAKGTPYFNSRAYTNEGMYSLADDYGTSYYFRGATDNNWVYFGGFYWRIIRIDGNGDIKLIYSGTTAPTSSESSVMTGTGTQINTGTSFNYYSNNAEYIGYMYEIGEQYGLENSSYTKNLVDNWYGTYLSGTSYEDYIVDSIYCGDRTSYNSVSNYYSGVQYGGMGTSVSNFGSNYRITVYDIVNYGPFSTSEITVSPSFECPLQNDSYTVSDTTNGNGALTYSVALITADEIVAAGLAGFYVDVDSNTTNYLYTANSYWTMSPASFSSGQYAALFCVYTNGIIFITCEDSTSSPGVRPVITVSGNTIFEGTGTWNDYYKVKEY